MIEFRPASAYHMAPPMILGLTGPSRSGKTYSALRIARGMVDNPGEIAVIDTETGRSRLYRGRFGDFLVGDLVAPFSYDRYLETIQAAIATGAKVVIVDSLSHGHEGPGGLLDQHDQDVEARMKRSPGANRAAFNMAAWIAPKRQLGKFTAALLQLSTPMIFCFRAKEKLKPVRGKEPEPLGFRPITSDELTYEMTSVVLLPENARGVPDLAAPATGLREPFDSFFRRGAQLDEALGGRIREWLEAEAKPPVSDVSPPKPEGAPAPAETTPPQDGSEQLSRDDIRHLAWLIHATKSDEAQLLAYYGVKDIAELSRSDWGQATARLEQRHARQSDQGAAA